MDVLSVLVTSYKQELNKGLHTSSAIVNSSDSVVEETKTVEKLKLHVVDLPAAFTGGSVEVTKLNCKELKMFMSKTNDIEINWRDGIGGFMDLQFLNHQNTYFNSSYDKSLNANIPFDFTEDLTYLKSNFGASSRNYIYFYCPFINENNEDLSFEYKLNLNQNPVDLSNSNTSSNPDSPDSNVQYTTLSGKMEDIIKNVKGDGNVEKVKERMQTASNDYYEISQIIIETNLHKKETPKVQKISLLEDSKLIQLVKFITPKKTFNLKTDKSVSGIALVLKDGVSQIIEFSNLQISDSLNLLKDDEDYNSESPNFVELYYLIYNPSKINELNITIEEAKKTESSTSKQLNQDVETNTDTTNEQTQNETQPVNTDTSSGSEPTVRRMLQESSSDSVNMYYSESELNDDYKAKEGMPWWLILIIVLLIIILLLLLVLIILCCCCSCFGDKNKDKYKEKKKKETKKTEQKKTEQKKENKDVYMKRANEDNFYNEGKNSYKQGYLNNNESVEEPQIKNIEIANYSPEEDLSYYEDDFQAPRINQNNANIIQQNNISNRKIQNKRSGSRYSNNIRKEGDSKVNHEFPDEWDRNKAL